MKKVLLGVASLGILGVQAVAMGAGAGVGVLVKGAKILTAIVKRK
jgi:hypothetical protein